MHRRRSSNRRHRTRGRNDRSRRRWCCPASYRWPSCPRWTFPSSSRLPRCHSRLRLRTQRATAAECRDSKQQYSNVPSQLTIDTVSGAREIRKAHALVRMAACGVGPIGSSRDAGGAEDHGGGRMRIRPRAIGRTPGSMRRGVARPGAPAQESRVASRSFSWHSGSRRHDDGIVHAAPTTRSCDGLWCIA
jgi:hypothetical protein